MGNRIGARLAIEGEREFKQALQNADAQLKALSSSLDLSAAKFAGQEKSMEALSAQYSILEKQYDTQTQKVDLIRKRLEQSAKEYGENSNQTLYWQTTLNRAETQLEKLRKKLQDTGESLETYDNGMEAAKDETDGFSEKIRAVVKDDPSQNAVINKVVDNLNDLHDGMYEYMTIKFMTTTYVEAVIYFETVINCVRLNFELLRNNKINLKQ